MTSMQQPFSWESLIPTSFKNTLYIPSLKMSVTAGSFVRYSAVEAGPPNVGRILEVVTSMDMIPDHENQPLLHLESLSEGQFEDDQPVQYAKVNIFKDRESFPADCNFPEGSDRFDRWQRIVQLGKCEWIPSYFIIGLAFVAIEDDGFFDDCHGMCNFFLVKYRIAENGTVSIIPRRACPPFPDK
ncbi:hypothetical protein MHU86_13463 [Fragilaria crotonensis]|nr:hypothetical protein MHU86_13463 [Fragilaria crotonensis]